MESRRFWAAGAWALIGFVLALGSMANAESQEDDQVAFIVSYHAEGLPVWRLDEKGQPQFDPSLLITLVKRDLPPETWNRAEVGMFDGKDGKSLLLAAPRDVHDAFQKVLHRQAAFSRHAVTRHLEDNLATATISNQRILLFAADPNSQAADDFFAAQAKPESQSAFRDYVVQCMTPSQAQLWPKWNETPTPKEARLAILAADGTAIDQAAFAVFRPEDRFDAQALASYLQTHALKWPDARAELEAAIEKAEAEDKSILVQMSGPNCGPCIMLSRYLASQADLLSRDYVVLKLDNRMPHAEELATQLAGSVETIPWMAVLAKSGERLVNSLGPEGNIGFPRSETARMHFRSMLETTASRLSEEDLDVILNGLPPEAN
jgi:thiol-disulfide isomerase/thioredoxin